MRDNANFFVCGVVCGSSFERGPERCSAGDLTVYCWLFSEIKEETPSCLLISRINKWFWHFSFIFSFLYVASFLSPEGSNSIHSTPSPKISVIGHLGIWYPLLNAQLRDSVLTRPVWSCFDSWFALCCCRILMIQGPDDLQWVSRHLKEVVSLFEY